MGAGVVLKECQPVNLLCGKFCSGIQFYLLLSPYLCFISFLYLDLFVLGENALISKGSLMQTKYLCLDPHLS